MPTWAKVLLIVLGIVVLLAFVAVGAGVYWWRNYGQGLVQSGKRSMEEGGSFGKSTDNEGCLEEGVARHRQAAGFGEIIKTNLFLRGCLQASRESPGFCDDVPKSSEFIRGGKWQVEQCERYGLNPQRQCAQLFQQVQQFCEERRTAEP